MSQTGSPTFTHGKWVAPGQMYDILDGGKSMGGIIPFQSDYSQDPDGTAKAFELASCDREIAVALKKLRKARDVGYDIAASARSTSPMVTDATIQILTAQIELTNKVMKRMLIELEMEKITRLEGVRDAF